MFQSFSFAICAIYNSELDFFFPHYLNLFFRFAIAVKLEEASRSLSRICHSVAVN